jgi:hypothetical protein
MASVSIVPMPRNEADGAFCAGTGHGFGEGSERHESPAFVRPRRCAASSDFEMVRRMAPVIWSDSWSAVWLASRRLSGP